MELLVAIEDYVVVGEARMVIAFPVSDGESIYGCRQRT